MSKALITCVSAHTAINLALHRAFKVDLNYRAFRQGESSFYDLYRRILDRPQSLGKDEPEQLAAYFEQVGDWQPSAAGMRLLQFHSPQNFVATFTERLCERLGLTPPAGKIEWSAVEHAGLT